MLNYFSSLKKREHKKIIVISTFTFFFILGCIVFVDYVISIDEPFHRLMGFYWLNYIFSFFPDLEISKNINFVLNNIKVTSFENISTLEPNDFVYGIVFDVPMAFFEILFGINDPKYYFQMRHFFNFLFFFIASIYFFRLLSIRFKDWKLPILGTFFFVLSPRIIANSFYNNKDLIFLSLFVISIYYTFKLLKDINLKNSFYFSFFTALSTCSRIIGITTLIIFIFFYFISTLSHPRKYLIKYKFIFLIILSFLFFVFLMWPYLWSNPINNFVAAFKIFSNYPRYMYILYDGLYIKTTAIPWHYPIKWILITTPVLYLIFFLIGFINIFLNFSKKFINIKENNLENDLWKNFDEKLDLFIFIYFFSFLFIVIKLDIVLYNGWRQLYFLYPLIIYISIVGLNKLEKILFKNKKIPIIISISSIYLFYIILQIYIMHPHQNVYFNFLAGKDVYKKYEVDYWGLSNRKFLENVALKEKNKVKINIGISSFTTMDRSFALVDKNIRKKFDIVGQEHEKADYIFTNFMSEVNKKIDKKYDIPNNFVLEDMFEINGIKIYEVYKRAY